MSNILEQICHRIADPGQYTPRGDNYNEPIPLWGARAVAMLFDEERARLAKAVESASITIQGNGAEMDMLRGHLREAKRVNDALRAERDQLAGWKESMLRVDGQCDWQALYQLLGMPLGVDIKANLFDACARICHERDEVKAQAEEAKSGERIERLNAEVDKWRDAARVICAAHVGHQQDGCPVCRNELFAGACIGDTAEDPKLYRVGWLETLVADIESRGVAEVFAEDKDAGWECLENCKALARDLRAAMKFPEVADGGMKAVLAFYNASQSERQAEGSNPAAE